MEKLLFTGASGFLGHIVKPILEKQYEITSIGITDQDNIKVNIAKDIPFLPEKYDVVLLKNRLNVMTKEAGGSRE